MNRVCTGTRTTSRSHAEPSAGGGVIDNRIDAPLERAVRAESLARLAPENPEFCRIGPKPTRGAATTLDGKPHDGRPRAISSLVLERRSAKMVAAGFIDMARAPGRREFARLFAYHPYRRGVDAHRAHADGVLRLGG
jgi:hypothetical protein